MTDTATKLIPGNRCDQTEAVRLTTPIPLFRQNTQPPVKQYQLVNLILTLASKKQMRFRPWFFIACIP